MQTNEGRMQNQPNDSTQQETQGGGIVDGILGTASSLGDTLRGIVRGEVELAKTELKQEAMEAGKAGGFIAGGGLLGLTGALFLLQALTHLLARKMPMWVSASIVGSALVAIAAALGVSGKEQLQDTDLKPEQTVQSLNEVKDTLTDAAQS